MVTRNQVSFTTNQEATKEIENKLIYRLVQKGLGTFSSKHEILGLLDEEYDELRDAIRADKDGIEPVAQELIDIAVVCIFGLACIRAGEIT